MPEQNIISSDFARDLDRRFRSPLMAFFLRRIRDRQDAEDLTQDTFARLIGSSSRFESEAQVEAYIFRVAANLLKDRGRRHKVRKQESFSALGKGELDQIENRVVEGRGPERVLTGQESLADAFEVLAELGERTRTIYILYRLEGMKHKDIASLLGLGLSTVEKHCMLAMAALAARLPGQGR